MKLPAYAGVAKIAWRQARRAPWRSALIVSLIAMPVAGLTGAAIVIRTAVPTPAERVWNDMGSADLMLLLGTPIRIDHITRLLPSGSVLSEQGTKFSSTVVNGWDVQTSLIEFSAPADQPPTDGMFHLIEGRFPTVPGEAAVQSDVLHDYGAGIGDRIEFTDVGISLLVTGIAVEPEHLSVSFALLGPGTLASEGVRSAVEKIFVRLPPGISPAKAAAGLSSLRTVDVSTREAVMAGAPFGRTLATGGSFGVASVALFGTCLIAAAAFVVGARRQLRTLGLVSAVGGEPRHVRATVLLGGVVLGLVGSCVGVVIGALGSLVLRPYLDRYADRIVGPLRIPITPLLGAIVLGTAAAALAAYAPARAAAKISTVEALEGRTPPARAPGRVAAAGLGISLVGALVVAWATSAHAYPWSDPWLALGLIAMLSGFLIAIPLVVTWIGRGAGRLPTAPRIAARDLARNGRRTAAALAAATIALALPIAVSAVTLSQDASERQVPFMASDQLSIGFFDGLVKPEPGDSDRLISDLRGALPGSVVVPLRTAAAMKHGKQRLIWVKGPLVEMAGETFRKEGTLVVGDANVLRAFHAEDGIPALEQGTIVAVGPGNTDGGVVHLTTQLAGDPNAVGGIDLPAVEAGATGYASLGDGYTYVISPGAAADLGLTVSEPSLRNPSIVLRAQHDLSGDEIQRVRDVASRYVGASVHSEGDLGSQNGTGRWAFGAGGSVLALAIVAIVVALLGAESRKDRAILAAVGAGPRTRRALAGASAWVVAVVAGALAVPAGLAPAIVFRVAQTRDYPIVVPWAAIAVALLLVPVIAGLVAAAGSREPKAASLLRPIA